MPISYKPDPHPESILIMFPFIPGSSAPFAHVGVFKSSETPRAHVQLILFLALIPARWCIQEVWTNQQIVALVFLLSSYVDRVAASVSESWVKSKPCFSRNVNLKLKVWPSHPNLWWAKFPVSSKLRWNFWYFTLWNFSIVTWEALPKCTTWNYIPLMINLNLYHFA